MRQVMIIFTILFSLPCISQVYEGGFESKEAADSFLMEVLARHKQGNYEIDIPQLLSYKEYFKNDLSENIELYSTICQILGNAYLKMGKTKEAEAIYLESIELFKEDFYDSPAYRLMLSSLGILYTNLRNYEKARDSFKEAIFLFEKNLDLGELFANALSSYAVVLLKFWDNLMAKMMIDWAKEIYINNTNPGDKNISTILSNLSIIYNSLGYKEEAINSLLEAKEILQKEGNLVGNHMPINNLAVMYAVQGDYKQALQYFREAYTLCNNIQDKGLIGAQLAYILFLTKDKKAFKMSSIVSEQIISDVISKFSFMSNEERERYWEDNIVLLTAINMIFANSGNDEYNGHIYNNNLFSKGLLLKTSNLIKSEIYNSGDEESIMLLNKKLELEKLIEQNVFEEDTLKIVKDSINTYDKILTDRSSGYASFKKELTANWSGIKNSLNDDEAAIEFIEIPVMLNDSITSDRKYYALILRKKLSHPRLVPLCLSRDLSELTTKKPKTKLDVFISGLYASDNSDHTIGNQLYNYIWEPIDKELKGINTVYYSPIGQLNSISFNALSNNSNCLSERYNLHLLSSTSEVIKYKQKKESTISDAIVYGGIKYDTGTDEMIAEARGYNINHHLTRSIENDSTRSGWSYLEGTSKEASNIISILNKANIKSQIITESKANEESFKALDNASPSLLHIATHGFFLSDPVQLELNPFMQKKQAKWYSNRLLRSGLLFAGANKAWLGEDIVEGIDDGILTAEEISKLNLSKTKMVVLSACETGLGEIESTEGVFGLQRAFKLAGVQTLIMSLWKVPDLATSKLMIAFYNNWTSGMELHQAFQKAQQLIKKEYPSPYYWAGFVMLD